MMAETRGLGLAWGRGEWEPGRQEEVAWPKLWDSGSSSASTIDFRKITSCLELCFFVPQMEITILSFWDPCEEKREGRCRTKGKVCACKA
jgi:hypothetical protein